MFLSEGPLKVNLLKNMEKYPFCLAPHFCFKMMSPRMRSSLFYRTSHAAEKSGREEGSSLTSIDEIVTVLRVKDEGEVFFY